MAVAIHIKHDTVFDARITADEYVIVECDIIPYNLVEICDHILSKGAKPLLSIRHDAYSYIKLKKSDLACATSGIPVVSEFNNNFTNTFIFEPETLDLSLPVYITESKTINDFVSNLERNGVEHTAKTYSELASMLDTMNADAFDFKTCVVKSSNHEKALERILGACMKTIRDNSFGDEYKERLSEELHDYNRYGLIGMLYDVYCYYKAWSSCLLLRGSANNSLVLYLLGVSKIDPVRYDLPFERFINGGKIFSNS